MSVHRPAGVEHLPSERRRFRVFLHGPGAVVEDFFKDTTPSECVVALCLGENRRRSGAVSSVLSEALQEHLTHDAVDGAKHIHAAWWLEVSFGLL